MLFHSAMQQCSTPSLKKSYIFSLLNHFLTLLNETTFFAVYCFIQIGFCALVAGEIGDNAIHFDIKLVHKPDVAIQRIYT